MNSGSGLGSQTSPSNFAIADTCFLIDWARYRKRDILFNLFDAVFVPEEVISEIRSENTIAWISRLLAEDKLSLYTTTPDEVEEARRLIEISRTKPQMPSIDLPEAICLVVGRRRGYVVLTENRGALLAPLFLEEFKGVTVWRSLEVIFMAIKRGIMEPDCNNVYRPFKEYSEDTLHIFPRKALNKVLEEVRELCRKR